MDASLVSVIIIFWNGAPFLHEAIESVLSQTYTAWRLYLVDDGSTDESTAIAKRYAESDPERICYLDHPGHENRGMSASRNLGLRYAKGAYVAFLDADDVWVSNLLEDQVSILQSHPEAAMVFGPIRYWYSWTGKPEDRDRDYVEDTGVPPNTLLKPPDLLTLFLQNKATVPSGYLLRREIADQVGGFEDSFHSFYEDQVFCAKVCLSAPVYSSGECWYWYRQHPQATCTVGKATGAYYTARLAFLNWLANYLVKQEFTDPGVWQAVERALLPFRSPTRYRISRAVQLYQSRIRQMALVAAGRVLPASTRRWLNLRWQAFRGQAPAGLVRFGDLRRTRPVSPDWGYRRGLPVDRYYLEQFLSTHQVSIQGRVLEILDDTYTRRFGGDRVLKSDVLHVKAGNPKATLVGDLTSAAHLPSDSFDCIIITQTIHLIYDVRAAIRTLHRILKPGGLLLVTVPGISQISRYDMDRWGDYWRFTTRSIRKLFEECFPPHCVEVTSYGNVLAAAALLYGLAAGELRAEELDDHDPDYQVLLAVRAVKPASNGGGMRAGR